MKSFALCLICVLASPAMATPPNNDSVMKLMELTRSTQMAEQMINGILPMMKKHSPEVPETFWKEYLGQLDFEGFARELVPVYQRHLTQAEVDAAIAFWSSPAGQKLLDATPKIMSESMVIAQAWGQKVVKSAIDEARADGASKAPGNH